MEWHKERLTPVQNCFLILSHNTLPRFQQLVSSSSIFHLIILPWNWLNVTVSPVFGSFKFFDNLRGWDEFFYGFTVVCKANFTSYYRIKPSFDNLPNSCPTLVLN